MNQPIACFHKTFVYCAFIFFVICSTDCKGGKRSDATVQRLFQSELDHITKDYGFPGMTAAYILADGEVQVFASGLADIEQNIPMAKDSRMLAASIGKTFTGATALALAREGILDLDVPIQQYQRNNEWISRLPNANSITLRHLLTHSSGIEDHVYSPEFAKAVSSYLHGKRAIIKPEEMVSFIFDAPARFKPGSNFHYSDTGYIIVGMVIESVTNKDLYTEIRRRFLKPLGLNRTEASNKMHLPGLAAGYLATDNPFGLPPKTTRQPGWMVWNPGIEWAGGGFISNSRDLAIWGKALYEGKALSGNYLRQLLQAVPAGPSVQYGIATVIRDDGDRNTIYGHKGWIPGYCSSLQYYKKHKLSIAFQINTDKNIMGNKQDVIEEIEKRLLKIINDSTF